MYMLVCMYDFTKVSLPLYDQRPSAIDPNGLGMYGDNPLYDLAPI